MTAGTVALRRPCRRTPSSSKGEYAAQTARRSPEHDTATDHVTAGPAEVNPGAQPGRRRVAVVLDFPRRRRPDHPEAGLPCLHAPARRSLCTPLFRSHSSDGAWSGSRGDSEVVGCDTVRLHVLDRTPGTGALRLLRNERHCELLVEVRDTTWLLPCRSVLGWATPEAGASWWSTSSPANGARFPVSGSTDPLWTVPSTGRRHPAEPRTAGGRMQRGWRDQRRYRRD